MNLVELLELKYPGQIGWGKEIELIDKNDGKGIRIGRWDHTDPLPTKEQLLQWAQEYDLAYRQKIAVEQRKYPPIVEQLDMMYWDKINNATTWQDMITSIKTANPKPTV